MDSKKRRSTVRIVRQNLGYKIFDNMGNSISAQVYDTYQLPDIIDDSPDGINKNRIITQALFDKFLRFYLEFS